MRVGEGQAGKALLDVLLEMFSNPGMAWEADSMLQGLNGHGPLTGVATAGLVPAVAVWVGLRALLGLYPAYGFDAVEQLRRHTYSMFIAPAMLAVFAIGFHVAGLLSRL